jgi:hypothetical protein
VNQRKRVKAIFGWAKSAHRRPKASKRKENAKLAEIRFAGATRTKDGKVLIARNEKPEAQGRF